MYSSTVHHRFPPLAPPTRMEEEEPRAGREALFLDALRSGDMEARTRFFLKHRGRVERVLYGVLGPDREVPDLIQDVFLGALRGLAGYRGDAGGLSSWLNRIAVLTARKAIRRRRALSWLGFRAPEQLPEEASSGLDPERAVRLARSYAALSELRDRERLALTLHYVAELTLEEVAEACDVSRATVIRWIADGRERIVRRAKRDPTLAEWFDDDPFPTKDARTAAPGGPTIPSKQATSAEEKP